MKAGILLGQLKNRGNEGALIRTAEVFGLNHVFVLGKKESYGASQGTEKHMTYLEFKNEEEFIDYCLSNHHSIVCIENINGAKELDEIDKYPANPIFVTGNENTGIPKKILKFAKLCVKIEQGFGYGNCLNTSIAASIVIHDFFQKMKSKRKKLWGIQ